MSTFNNLITEYENLDKEIEEAEGVIDGPLEKRRDDLIARIPEKVDACAYWMDAEKAEIDMLKARVKEMQEFLQSKERRLESFREYIKVTLSSHNVTKVSGNYAEFSLREAKPKVVADEDLVPAQYFKEKRELVLDKEMLREDLEAGYMIPGARLEPVKALYKTVAKKPSLKP